MYWMNLLQHQRNIARTLFYFKEEKKHQKWVQQVFRTAEFGSGKCVKNSLVLRRKDNGEGSNGLRGFSHN